MYKAIVDGFIYANYHYGIKIGYIENEEWNKRQKCSDGQVDNMGPVICENI